MKITIGMAACFSALLVFACHKSSAPATSNNIITGKWTLIETLVDPGNGSARWLPTDRPGYYFIRFNTDNSTETNTLTGYGDLKQYQMVNDSTFNLMYAGGTTVTHNFTLRDSTLSITGGCREACGWKFTRAPM